MTRTEIIQGLIDKYGFKSYLEIGVQNKANNFNKIRCETKLCVDPDTNAQADCIMTSDEYFENSEQIFDVIFIDGLHEEEQVIDDINNSLRHLSYNGFIVVHDCLPLTEEMQIVPRISKQWTGDTWKAIVRFRERTDIQIATVNTDFGCGIISKGSQKKLNRIAELNWAGYCLNKDQWLNVISVDKFKQFLNEQYTYRLPVPA